jgi:hypothetical protein
MENRIRFTTAAQVAEAFPEVADDLGDIPEGASPLDHLATLMDDENPMPALTFAALALPKREAVWWGCLCVRGCGASGPAIDEGLRLTEAWVRSPEEAERRAAGEFAEQEYFEGPGAWIAFAAFTTSGSLAPAGLQSVPPGPELSGRAVATAVLLAAEDDDPLARIAKLRSALESAKDFASGADGTGPWKSLTVEAAPRSAAAG